jgi:hypothetical protein
MFARLFVENCVPAGCAMFWLPAGVTETLPIPPLGVTGAYCPEVDEYVNTCPFPGALDATGTLWIAVAFALDPHGPHAPLPSRQFSDDAVPLPNSLVGTSPPTKSAFAATDASTYCFAAACNGAVGFPLNVKGPVIAPPAVGK